ncbi:uncharacterized protein [Cicer arietinum]|uniref:Protein RESTRICTED TEV MOVEMENT 2-like n=1 Tax=Cicer arietinum TaxID=3827 RepID=A0A1S3DVV5_CICAR|nr:protein RESTRICTED TEV MOVEMENT 2-like [Cicer arietinum]
MSSNPQFSSKISNLRSLVRRVYETVEPRSETKETPQTYLLHVYLPGFTKDRIKITLLDSSRMVKITGERPIQGNKWRRFDQTYPVPENSEAETLEANFEQGTLILKIQKKLISQSQQQVEQSPQDLSNNKALSEAKPEKLQAEDNMKSDSPQTQSFEKKTQNVTHDDTLSQIPQDTISNNNNNPQKDQHEFEPKPTVIEKTKTQIDEKPQNGQEEYQPKSTTIEETKTEIDEKLEKGQEEFKPKTTTIEKTNTLTNEKSQKGQEEFQPKPTTIEKTKTQIDEKLERVQEEFQPKTTTIEKINTLTNEKSQKGQEEFQPKPTTIEKTKTPIDEKLEKGQEELKPKTTTIENINTLTNKKSQKGQEEFQPKPTTIEKTKSQIEEKLEKGQEELESKPTSTKKEVNEKNEMPYESSKTIKDVKNHNLTEKEIENTQLFPPENEKESSGCGTSLNEEGKNGIRKIAAASSQFITRIADGKWRGEERHLVENIGAAVLVIAAFGAYVSYRFSS